jgi:serine/threonine-protein kinase PknG
VAALDQISTSSAHFTAAGATGVELLLEHREIETIDEQTLVDAGDRVSRLGLESAAKRAEIRLRVFGAALDWLRAGNTPRAPRLLGVDFTEPAIRRGMEDCYRVIARDTSDLWERITLVEKANAVRPRSRL